MRRVAFIILWVLTVLPGWADSTPNCEVCAQPTKGKYWHYKSPARTNVVCDVCHQLPNKCSVCGLPAPEGHIKMGDGRVICKKDSPRVVVLEEEAVRLFWEARREAERIGEGHLALRSPHLKIRLFDSPFWASKKVNPDADVSHLLGIAASPVSAGEHFHNVNLLGGVLRESLGTTSAHEYMHLWINENRPESHKIDGDTVEAICELLAYKVAVFRQDKEQLEKSKSNTYTKGKILELMSYEQEFGFQAVLQWVKTGTEPTLAGREIAKPPPVAEIPFFVPAAAVRPAATNLVLKGVMGSEKRRLALINDRTFEKAEEGKVRVGDKTVVVKCVDILVDAVVVRIDGAAPVTLKLDGR
jgi:hypothetical protein